ncbi:MAG TPA: hypothetical protein PLA71_00825 [Saccharofermentans sp.]|nr:hypothetical protein [Saccharofermentans sp.]
MKFEQKVRSLLESEPAQTVELEEGKLSNFLSNILILAALMGEPMARYKDQAFSSTASFLTRAVSKDPDIDDKEIEATLKYLNQKHSTSFTKADVKNKNERLGKILRDELIGAKK